MKHKHAEMIKAWANNCNLVILVKGYNSWISTTTPHWDKSYEYFLCLPKHKKAVLELLNGGEAQANVSGCWLTCNLGEDNKWDSDFWYMNDQFESRVKPKKQTRYAYVHKNGYIGDSFGSKDDLASYFGRAVEDERVITFEIEL